MISATRVRTVPVPADRVWSVLSDHEGMSAWAPGLKVTVDHTGATEQNGTGTVRRLGIGYPGPIVEEITTFTPGERLGYRAVAGVPLRNYRGEVALRPAGSGTEIAYTVSADRRLPLVEDVVVQVLATVLLLGLVRAVGS